MSIYDLPTALEVAGSLYEIRSDYRPVLDICMALNDAALSEEEKMVTALDIFYPGLDTMPPSAYQEAVEQCFWFINCGEETSKKSPKLMDWKQDFPHIVGPVNRVLGMEARAARYLHWWSFVAAYFEIGDCLFSQIVRIRSQRAAGKPLDKADREWYRRNRELVDFSRALTEQETDTLDLWTGKTRKKT